MCCRGGAGEHTPATLGTVFGYEPRPLLTRQLAHFRQTETPARTDLPGRQTTLLETRHLSAGDGATGTQKGSREYFENPQKVEDAAVRDHRQSAEQQRGAVCPLIGGGNA
jgi:hypothetical protein